MDFQVISNIFGGSIFPQDYRLDISTARERISELKKAYVSDAGSSEGQLLLLEAVLCSITGELAKYESLLRKAKEVADSEGDDHLSLRCYVYLKYSQWLIRASPPLDFWSDWKAQTEDFDDTFLSYRGLWLKVSSGEPLDIMKKFNDWLWDLSEGCVWPEIECRVLLWLWRLTWAMWRQGYHHHPDYPCDYVWARTGRVYKGMVDMNWAGYEFTKTKRKLPKTATFMKRLMAEGHLAGIDPDQKSIASLEQDCKDQDDQIGVANIELIKGDRIYSHPWTSPIALNLMLHASDLAWNNEFEGSCKKTESRRSEDAFQKAESCYKKSFQIFKKEGCRRGMGASRLRSACIRGRKILDAIVSSNATFSSNESATEHIFNETSQLLQEALDLFEFDEANINIVRTHELLLEIFRGSDLSEIMLRKASKIGMWGRENGNPRISRFAGILLLRAGKMIFNAPEHAKSTRACIICAQFVFNRLKEPLMEGRAVASQALMYRELGNFFLAREKVMMSCNVLLSARQWFLCAVRSNDQKRFARIWINLAISYKDRFMDIFKSNSHQLKEWEQKLSELRGCRSFEHQGDHLIEQWASVQPTRIPDHDRKVAQDWFRAKQKSSEDDKCLGENFDSHLRHREAIIKHSANTDLADSEVEKIIQLSADDPEHLLLNGLCKISTLMQQCEFDESRNLNFDLLPKMFGGRGSSSAHPGRSKTPALMIGARLDNYFNEQALEAQLSVLMCFCVQDWQLGETVLVKASELQLTILDFENDKSLHPCELSVALAAIVRNRGYLKDAFKLYMLVLNRVGQNNKAQSDVEDRKSNLAPKFMDEAFSGLASIYLECEDSALEEFDHTEGIDILWNHFGQGREDRALSCLEQGRSRVLLDLLGLEHNTLAYRTWLYNERLSQIDNERLSAESQRPVLQGSDGDYRLVEAEIKREDDIKCLANAFSKAHLNQRLVDAANPYEFVPQDSVVISINVSAQKTILFYVTSAGIQRYHFGSLTSYELKKEVSGFLKHFRRLKNPSFCPKESSYGPCLKNLSDLIIRPAEDIISRKSHVIFLVSQPLNKFPLSALFFLDKPLFLSKEVSSCPSLTVLQRLRNRRNDFGDKQYTSMVFTAPPDSEQVETPTMEPLDMSAASVMHMSSQFDCDVLAAQQLTPEEFGRTFSKSDVMFIATHGRQPDQDRLAQSTSSWEYAVLLGSRSSFRVVDLLKWESQAALVIFEACISGLVEDSGANESVGFSHMVLACGANAYLGAMWEVSDQASALLMYFFFKELAMARKRFEIADGERRRGRISLASCLRRAQIALYNTDKEATVKLLGEFQKSCQCKKSGDGLSDRQRKILCDSLEFALEDIEDENPDGTFLFRNAFFYAPFMLVGNGSLEVK